MAGGRPRGSLSGNAEAERDQRRVAITQRYLQGWPQWKIGEEVGLSQQAVSLELAIVRKGWKEEAQEQFKERIFQELAKIDEAERHAWEQFARSCKDAEEHSEGTKGIEPFTKTTTKGQCGDPRYLTIVLQCVERRCKLLGLDAPQKVAQTNADGTDVTPDEYRARAFALVDWYRERTGVVGASCDPSDN